MNEPIARRLGAKAADMVLPGAVLGLGSGRAAEAFLRALAARVSDGLQVRGVATSEATAALARQLGVPLATLDELESIDLAVDGADEVSPALDLIKGYGGALLREKVVAEAARRLVILVGPEKLVDVLGARGRLPVEVAPFARAACARRLRALGYETRPRVGAGGDLYVTDNGNHILDCAVSAIPDPRRLDDAMRAIPGVIATGLFVGLAQTVLVGREDGIDVRTRKP
jgi:ribose 5-phosphate isomerase A